jgi:flavorubredoxin
MILKRVSLSMLALVLSLSVAACECAAQNDEQLDVLIIYSSGTPFKTVSDMKPKEVDAVTSPTPVNWNCKKIAENLGTALGSRKCTVRIANVTEIKHRNEILDARLVVLGTPARFWNVSWEMKKLLDEQFGKIYVMEKNKLGKKRIAAFAMAEIKGSAEDALEAIERMVGDCNGRFGPTAIFLTEHSRSEVEERIEKFADVLAKFGKR